MRSLWYPSIGVLRTPAIGHWTTRRDDLLPAIAKFLDGLDSPGTDDLSGVAACESEDDARVTGEVA